jgi:hypothetical protein
MSKSHIKSSLFWYILKYIEAAERSPMAGKDAGAYLLVLPVTSFLNSELMCLIVNRFAIKDVNYQLNSDRNQIYVVFPMLQEEFWQ